MCSKRTCTQHTVHYTAHSIAWQGKIHLATWSGVTAMQEGLFFGHYRHTATLFGVSLLYCALGFCVRRHLPQ